MSEANDFDALVKYVPYIETIEDYVSLKPLKATGRWKIESGPYYTMRMFIEHQGWLFKRWVSEDRIVFKPEQKSAVFNCT